MAGSNVLVETLKLLYIKYSIKQHLFIYEDRGKFDF